MVSADIVLRGGKVLTVDNEFSIAQAIAVQGEHILAVGSDSNVASLIGPKTRVIELRGRTVVPGLHDSHIHTMGGASDELAVSLAQARSMKDVQAAFAARAAETPSGHWILGGSGWHESQLSEGRLPVRQELDAVTPNNPVYLRRGGHVAVANSAALKLAGITKDTPDPKGGVIVRDPATGEPTGALIERSAFSLVAKHVPAPTRDERIKGLKLFIAKLNSKGITATLEPGLSLDEIAAYMELWRSGGMTTRVRLLQKVSGEEDVAALSSVLAPNFGDDYLRVGGFKFLSDGGIEAAYMSERYNVVEGEQNDPEFVGKLILPAGGLDELRRMFLIAAERRWQVQVHAVGDATITAMVDLMEEVNEKYPLRDLRWTIMHIFLPTEASLDKIKRLGLYVTVQDHPVKLGHNMTRYWGEERAARSIPVRSILDKEIPAGGGTDAPVVDWNPFESMWWMTTRKVYAQGTTRVLGPEEAVTRQEALRLYTMGSAGNAFMEDRIGSIEPRKYADLAVLSDDFLTVADDDLPNIRALLTMVGGKIVHEAGL